MCTVPYVQVVGNAAWLRVKDPLVTILTILARIQYQKDLIRYLTPSLTSLPRVGAATAINRSICAATEGIICQSSHSSSSSRSMHSPTALHNCSYRMCNGSQHYNDNVQAELPKCGDVWRYSELADVRRFWHYQHPPHFSLLPNHLRHQPDLWKRGDVPILLHEEKSAGAAFNARTRLFSSRLAFENGK